MPFDISFNKSSSSESSLILKSFMEKINGSYSYQVQQADKSFSNIPFLLICESMQEFMFMVYWSGIGRYNTKALLFLVYISNATFLTLQNSSITQSHEFIDKLSFTILHHAFFIINEPSTVILATVEWFDKFCNHAVLTKINTFDKSSMRWVEKLKYHEKFINFHGCELSMLIPIARYPNQHFWGHAAASDEQGEFELSGLTPIIFKILSHQFNFKPLFKPRILEHPFTLK